MGASDQGCGARVRTVPKAVEYIRSVDPDTAVTKSAIYSAIKHGDVSCVKVGTRNLVNVDEIMTYFSGGGRDGE